jgi:KUP system potassium uptake protein
MATSSILAVVAVWKIWKGPLWFAVALLSPFLLVEAIFLASNLLKLFSGGFVPLLIAGMMIWVMYTWVAGSRRVADVVRRDASLEEVLALLARNPPLRVHGTAVFLTSEPSVAPAALMHNLKHNHVLHERIILLTVRTAGQPRVADKDIAAIENVAPDVFRVTLTYGFMQSPNVSRGLALARQKGLPLDILKTSFFVSRRTVTWRPKRGVAHWQDILFIYLSRNATSATDFFHIPTSRVVELGDQIIA